MCSYYPQHESRFATFGKQLSKYQDHVFSHVPSPVWTRTKNPEKNWNLRKSLSIGLSAGLCYTKIVVLYNEHPDITNDIPGLYDRDGIQLSDIGSHIFMVDIREALRNIL